jgi:uncharacterized protein involved in exopolysaccharide biosynthesis
MLQTLGSDEMYRPSEQVASLDRQQTIDLRFYANAFKQRFLYFLGVFGLLSILGLYVAASLQPIYRSEGKILVQSQEIAPDILAPVVTATATERAHLIEQRVLTRDRLLSIASKFHLFPSASNASDVLDLMRKRVQIMPIPDFDGQLRPNSHNVVFTVSFGYENRELAMRVANEFVTLIVNGDERSRNGPTMEMVKLLTSQAKDIEDKLEATQMRLLEIARRPHEAVAEISDEQRSQQLALDALKTELIQKRSIYSEAHPAVIALKKRIAAMERQLAQTSTLPTHPQAAADDDIEGLKRQSLALEKQLADANSKLANARLREKLDGEQQDRMQVIEAPSLPEKPEKSKKILIVGFAFVLAAMLGIAAAIGPELLNGSIRSRDQLSSVIASSRIVCIPYMATRADIIRARLQVSFAVIGVLVILAAWAGLATAIVLHLPVDASLFDKGLINLHVAVR